MATKMTQSRFKEAQMKRVTCNSCESLRGLAEGYRKRFEQKKKELQGKNEIIRQLKTLVKVLEGEK